MNDEDQFCKESDQGYGSVWRDAEPFRCLIVKRNFIHTFLEVTVYDYEESDPRYAGHRRDALRNRRVIPANTVFATRGLQTIRRPLPNTNLILGGI